MHWWTAVQVGYSSVADFDGVLPHSNSITLLLPRGATAAPSRVAFKNFATASAVAAAVGGCPFGAE